MILSLRIRFALPRLQANPIEKTPNLNWISGRFVFKGTGQTHLFQLGNQLVIPILDNLFAITFDIKITPPMLSVYHTV